MTEENRSGNEFHYKETLLRHTYEIDSETIHELQESFKTYLNIFLAYVRSGKPASANYFERVTLGRFFKKLFMLITFLIHPIDREESLKSLNKMSDISLCDDMLYEQCREFFGLTGWLEPKTLEPEEWSLDEWGKNYWNLLHSLSILVQYECQENSDNPAIDYLALVMVNFHIILPCGICSEHYKGRNPLISITLPILYAKDPVYVIYELHNAVRVTNGLDKFPLESFLRNWNIRILSSEYVEVDIKEPLL